MVRPMPAQARSAARTRPPTMAVANMRSNMCQPAKAIARARSDSSAESAALRAVR